MENDLKNTHKISQKMIIFFDTMEPYPKSPKAQIRPQGPLGINGNEEYKVRNIISRLYGGIKVNIT